MTLYADLEGDNVSWAGALGLDGFEPWEPDDDPYDGEPAGGCAYCGATEVREWPEPFGNKDCCERCFARLIGDESDDPEPFRCGVWLAAQENVRLSPPLHDSGPARNAGLNRTPH